VDYSVSELTEGEVKGLLESYSALLKALPDYVRIHLVKESIEPVQFLKKISNEILNTQVDLENAVDEPKKIKLNTKLEKLRKLYNMLLEGKPFSKITLILTFRVEASSKELAKSLADYYESLVSSTFKKTYGLELERASYSEILDYLLGAIGGVERHKLKGVVMELERISPLQPIKLDNVPKLEKSVIVGVEINTGHPIEIAVEELYKHFLVIGPTGKGKTTLLASIIEQLVSDDLQRVIAFDFKGDLVKYLPRNLLTTITPSSTPLSFYDKPREIDSADWKIIFAEALSHAGGFSSEVTIRALNAIDNKNAAISIDDPGVHVLAPFSELFTREAKSAEFVDLIREGNVLVNVEGLGAAFQNAYVSICIGIIRQLLLKGLIKPGIVVVIDDAWRILELKTLRELVREGRSRKVGMVLSTQSPSDPPRDLVENVHSAVLFGSRNRDYIARSISIFNIPEEVAAVMPRLSVGEGVYVNVVNRDVKIIKTFHLKIN
jgi:energy-coupling factor transporter ATP-binding protein EcfA2